MSGLEVLLIDFIITEGKLNPTIIEHLKQNFPNLEINKCLECKYPILSKFQFCCTMCRDEYHGF